VNASLRGIPLRLAHWQWRILFAVLLCIPPAALAQTTNLTYTNDYPSVERVKAEIKGSDPTDTLARQVGVLAYLSEQIKRIKLNRDYRGPYTPDELRLITAYDLNAYNIVQDYKKSHTPAEFESFDRLQFNYTIDRDFRAVWTKRLIGQQGQAAYSSAQADLAATQKRHYDEVMRQNEEAKRQAAPQGQTGGLSNDPTAVATRRCLELGGGPMTCMGKSFTNGLMGMALGAAGLDRESLTGPGRAGVVLSGRYRNPATLASLDFGTDNVSIIDCGKLVADGHGYTIAKSSNALQVTIDNEPRPIVLTMRPDNGLSGPGPVDVKGRIIIGYHTVTSTLYVNGAPAVGGSCGGVCQTSTQVPDYAPKIERCTIGSLNPPPPQKASTSAAMPDGLGAMAMLLTAGQGGTDAPPPLPGLRMAGQYSGSGGLILAFDAGNVILDCGPAHVRSTYTVHNTPNALVVNVENSGGPFTLTVQPDNTLRGSGSPTVNGRLVSGMNGNDVTYVPRSNTCEVGTLTPKAGSNASASVASSATNTTPPPVTRVASSASPSPAAPSVPARSANGPGSAHLQISTAFPAGANPLAGRAVFLYKDTLPNVLSKAGATVAPGATPGQAMKAWVVGCRPPANCTAVATAMQSSVAGKAQFDSTGHATLTPAVSPGSYYVSGSARGSGGVLVWDVKVELKSGDNSNVLDQSNAEVVP
jgi:hypothetical protein